MEGRHIKCKWLVEEPYREKTIKIEAKRKCVSLILYTKIHIHSHNYTHTQVHTPVFFGADLALILILLLMTLSMEGVLTQEVNGR